MLKIVPLSAQHEGNLVTTREDEYMRFEHLCQEALTYARKYILNKQVRNFIPEASIKINWWEKAPSKFWIPEKEIRPDPKTYSEVLLERFKPKPKKSPKPSRLYAKIYFDEKDKQGNSLPLVVKKVYQLGIIEWTTASASKTE